MRTLSSGGPSLVLPRLRWDQWRIASHPARYKWLCMGRRWGKTTVAGAISVASANAGVPVAWVAPTYKNTRPLWKFALGATWHLKSSGVDINKAEREITFPNGGWLGLYSADNISSLLGNKFKLVIVDEAARIHEDAWTEAIMPTLADLNGEAIMISTPKGRNWFWREWTKAKADGVFSAAFTAPSSDNPNPNIKAAALKAKEMVSERSYRQEWLAEFVEDGSFFPNVEIVCTAQPEEYKPFNTYVIGADWARSSDGDFTVFSVFNATTKAQAYIERMRGQTFEAQFMRLVALRQRYNADTIVAEYNAAGGPIVEQLQSSGLPVIGFTTTASSKHKIITALELAMDQKSIRLLNDETLKGELSAYEKKDRSGIPSYGAPEGMHDDTVIATALSLHAVDNRPSGFAFSYT